MMNLTHKSEQLDNKTSVFHLSGKILSKEDYEKIGIEITNSIESKRLQIVLCLANLDYMNSTGLSFLVSSYTKVKNNGGKLLICEISQKVKELITITKLNTILGVFDTLDEAIKSFELKTN